MVPTSGVSCLSVEAPGTWEQRQAIPDLVLESRNPQAESGGVSRHLVWCGFPVAM